MDGKFPVDCQLCASLSLPFFAYWGAPRHNRRHSFQRTLPRMRPGTPAQEHTCKNRKTYLRPTAVSWGLYLLPSPQPAKGKYSVNLVIPAAHLPFPAKLHPLRQVQEVSKKAERPTGCPAFCYITSFCSKYSIWNFSITIYPGYSDTAAQALANMPDALPRKPWSRRKLCAYGSHDSPCPSCPLVCLACYPRKA